MGDKMYTLVIKVDLSCCRCQQAIQDYLCRMQRKVCMQIASIEYDVKKDVVLVSCPSNPEQLKRELLCKLPKIIKGIDIKEPQKPDPKKQDFLKKCEEEYKEICKCIEKCKKECEEKYWKECEDKFKCKCKYKCECNCKEKVKPKPLTCPSPLVCCARPCPCWTAWSNNYRCCSCGAESWPGRSGPGWSSGPSNCEPSQPPTIILESPAPPCSIM